MTYSHTYFQDPVFAITPETPAPDSASTAIKVPEIQRPPLSWAQGPGGHSSRSWRAAEEGDGPLVPPTEGE